jgi:hypothetical protein
MILNNEKNNHLQLTSYNYKIYDWVDIEELLNKHGLSFWIDEGDYYFNIRAWFHENNYWSDILLVSDWKIEYYTFNETREDQYVKKVLEKICELMEECYIFMET